MALIILRLHPVEPVDGDDFTGYLDGLQIKVFDLAFDNLGGVELGEAGYVAPPGDPWDPHPDTGIVQHFIPPQPIPLPPQQPVAQAVATAVIEIGAPAGHPEHDTSDLRLEITRGGGRIVHRQVYFNVAQSNDALPSPADFPGLDETSLFLPLPEPGREVLPGDAFVELPTDGTPPRFDDLRSAVEIVLGNDPGAGFDLAALTPRQARHVADEIVWNQRFRPLPQPEDASLEQMYTLPDAKNDEDFVQARSRFEGELAARQPTGDAEAERLAGYVFALATALDSQRRSEQADRVGFLLVVMPGPAPTGARFKSVRVLFSDPAGQLNPSFAVPAVYFYALGASMPATVTAERRYRLATLEEEERVRDGLAAAAEAGVIIPDAAVNIAQAARRLRALGAVGGVAPAIVLDSDAAVQALVQAWLDFADEDILVFWDDVRPGGPLAVHLAAHLELVLLALTDGHAPLIAAIEAIPVADVFELSGRTVAQWDALFRNPDGSVNEALLPTFTEPGSAEERVAAFIRHVQKFFAVDVTVDDPDDPVLGGPPTFPAPTADPLTRFAAAYQARAGAPFQFGTGFDQGHAEGAAVDVFDGDEQAGAWLLETVLAIDELTFLAQPAPAEVRFSVMEALYARGFTSRQQAAALDREQFRQALVGTVAFEHADDLWDALEMPGPGEQPGDGGFQPVNPDGCLVNCLPPPHRSPLGLVAYLHELLALSADSTCEDPASPDQVDPLGALLAERRGPLGGLLATRANLETPLPLVDLVNECLEAVAANLPAPPPPTGAVFDTAGDQLGGHELDGARGHDPATLFAALPEHSTPATPVAEPDAYTRLQADFTHPLLPYAQALDVNRTYLRHLGSSRYAVMRRFRRDITELVLDPAAEPADFQRHLWRYPVRIEIAREYLGISAEEYELLYTQDIVLVPTPGRLLLRELYGFPADQVDGEPWTEVVLGLPEFLERTGLDYCQFLALWRSEFVRFENSVDEGVDASFPDCEPCHLDQYRIRFLDPVDPAEALRRLAVFIRLWRTLRALPGGGYRFTTLADICAVLRLFNADGTINPDFVRQLAAFQLLRDRFALALTEPGEPPAGATGADRTRLLALWVGPAAAGWAWALDELLDQVQYYARGRHRCGLRPPEFIKLLADNLDPLSQLAGFDPDRPADTWHARPTHTLRFGEVLAKLYASDFGVGEILFLFTADPHLAGDDPFPLQPPNEAVESPLGLPDDERPFSLWDLRGKLLAVEVADEQVTGWDWARIDASLRAEFGFDPPVGGPDPFRALGERFFPSVLEAAGYPVAPDRRQYRVPLANTAPLMWNTPPGPFRYDTASQELWTELPLTDEAVIAKLSRIRQLSPDEQAAVRELYFRPRADLAVFAFLFPNFGRAEEALIQEPDEGRRWAWFQRAFATAYARARVIAEHLAGHVAEWTQRDGGEGWALAWRLLQQLYADENRATASWEDDSGQPPPVTWPDQPSGGAFAALLGLVGTGLLGEYTPEGGALAWREVRGPMSAFGEEENAANAPVPTVLPAMDLQLTPAQARFVSVRNGFAIANPDGAPLGGAQGYSVRWSGALLVDGEGPYVFYAGAPTAEEEAPDFDAARDRRWRVMLRRGQRTWVLLSHRWPDETAPGDASGPLVLRRGAYQLTVELTQPAPEFDSPDDVRAITGGFQLKYRGPDSDDRLVTVPHQRLFQDRKDRTLGFGIDGLSGAAQRFLALHYTSSLRDIRRTYQRAFKALLFGHRLGLSARPMADDGQSEIGYLLAHADDFAGFSYYRDGAGFAVHRAFFDPNLLPLRDNYLPPPPAQDRRARPSPRRRQALFDWWERLFDYTMVRRDARTAPERPLWLLFHEAAESHEDNPAHLLRHMGVDLLHAPLVLRYFEGYSVTSADLEDERWSIRAWYADQWLDAMRTAFLELDVRTARPDLWAADDPGVPAAGEAESGNANLTRFVRDGCIEHGEPRRYQDVTRLNDGLRLRGRDALVASLCGMDRVPLPWGGVATEPKHLSELLLIDVEAGLCQRASRIEEAISAVQAFVQRARLGLEPGFDASAAFVLLWDRRFATFRVWEACKRRQLYRENWIDWDELEQARRGEAFRFLEAELRRATLTVPVPGGLEYWPDQLPPDHAGRTLLQAREPAHLRAVDPAHHGFDLLGTPERHARPAWLATVGLPPPAGPGDDDDGGGGPDIEIVELLGDDVGGPPGGGEPGGAGASERLPLWIQAAIRLGVTFLRVAAAGDPPAATSFAPRHPDGEPACCETCGAPHPATVDEYWFWLLDSRHSSAQAQDASWSWHDPDALPKLLHWESEPGVQLAWTRMHNGEFTQPRRSDEAVRISGGVPELIFHGRVADSLSFEVSTGLLPDGHDDPVPPGFRYDLATDTAVTLPLVVPPPAAGPAVGGLPAYPYFGYFSPGAPVQPPSPFAPAVAVAASLRANCRFEAALKWYELAFAPLQSDSSWLRCDDQGPADGDGPVELVQGDEPCCQDSTVASEEDMRRRSIVLHYLETLLEWGDAVLRRNTPEAFQQARVIYDTAARLLGPAPRTVIGADTGAPQPVSQVDLHPAPPNPRLLLLYQHTADRAALIHACVNAHRRRGGRPVFGGDSGLRDDWRTTADPCLDDADWCLPPCPYRFTYLIGTAKELAGEVRGLSAMLLAAYEKGDAEYLASLRATHERQLLTLVLENRRNQWREADWQLQALQKTKEITQTRHRYFTLLIQNGLNNREDEHRDLVIASTALRAAANVSEGIAQATSVTPDFFAGFPCSLVWTPGGTKFSGAFSALARISNGLSEIAASTGGLRLTEAGWERREEEWRHQVEVLDLELEQIERQILAAERRRDIALRELNNHQRQIEQSGEVHDFLRDKFTNHQLYLFLQQETAALHAQMYDLALHAARQAERAFNNERGHTADRFVSATTWDSLHEGLQAGERLQLSLRRMEHAYLDANVREYELTKHLSLRLHFPVAFLQLLTTGACEIAVPEWMFDLDYPGQYLRRIKNVSLTIPCVVGPYTGVHCRLTLLGSTTRVHPQLARPPHGCCPDGRPGNGYEVLPDDPRMVTLYAATEAIATSSGQNDTGMFELSFRDERYLPFEFAGAVSRWRIELPPENNQFDIDTVADVVMHLNYTAREGGEALRRAANQIAQRSLPGNGVRYVDVRHDLPDAWHRFQAGSPGDGQQTRELVLSLSRAMFPFLPGARDVRVTRIELLFEASGAVPSAHQLVEFLEAPRHGHGAIDPDDREPVDVACVASADWPGLYHGVLDELHLRRLHRGAAHEVGRYRFPARIGQVASVYLFCHYETLDPSEPPTRR